MRSMLGVVLVVVAFPLAGTGPVRGQKAKPAKEPVVAGQTVGYWIKALEGKEIVPRIRAINALMQAGPEARKAAGPLVSLFRDREATFLHPLAAVALSRIGADAVPELQKALADPSPGVRGGAALTLGQIGAAARATVPELIKALADRDASVRQAVVQALGRLGGVARPAVKVLPNRLEDDDASVRLEAGLALWRIASDTRGVAVLARALENKDASIVGRALAGLGEIGPRAKSASEAITLVLKHADVGVRIAAAETVFRVTGDAALARPVLVAATTAKDGNDRRAAVSALGVLGANAETVEVLVRFLSNNPDDDLRREAACALAAGGVKRAEARRALQASLADRDLGVRWWCAVSLAGSEGEVRMQEEEILRTFRLALFRVGDAEPSGKVVLDVQASTRAVPLLAEVLRSRPVRLQAEAARTLGQLGLDARLAQPDLVDALRSADILVRRAAAEALASLGTDAVAPLQRLLSNAEPRIREGAARALGRVGLPARGTLPALTRLLEDTESPVRAQAALALWAIDQRSDLALPILDLVLKNVDHSDRWEAVEAIGTISVQARPVIKGLLEILTNALKDRDVRVRVQAAKWLWRRTRLPTRVVPLLREGVSERDLLARLMVVETLGEMASDESAIPLLIRALEDRDANVRLAAVEGLARGGADLVKPLIGALESKSTRVRLGVVRALGMMGSVAKPAQRALSKLGTDTDPLIREAVKEAFRAMYPGNQEVMMKLLEELDKLDKTPGK